MSSISSGTPTRLLECPSLGTSRVSTDFFDAFGLRGLFFPTPHRGLSPISAFVAISLSGFPLPVVLSAAVAEIFLTMTSLDATSCDDNSLPFDVSMNGI